MAAWLVVSARQARPALLPDTAEHPRNLDAGTPISSVGATLEYDVYFPPDFQFVKGK